MVKKKCRKFSTGRGTKLKHSTAMDWDEWEKARRKHKIRYSTGDEPKVKHSTGTAMDRDEEGT